MSTSSPPHTSNSAPSLPREHWAQHPHYPDQVLLLGSHANFRRISTHLVEATAREGANLFAAGSLYLRWISAMGGHEHYEETRLYPYLSARWGVDFEPARAGHRALHERDSEVRRALLQQAQGPPEQASAPLHAAFVAHAEHLHAHLDLEEEMVIPLLLALSPREFRHYSESPLWRLLEELGGDPHKAPARAQPAASPQ